MEGCGSDGEGRRSLVRGAAVDAHVGFFAEDGASVCDYGVCDRLFVGIEDSEVLPEDGVFVDM